MQRLLATLCEDPRADRCSALSTGLEDACAASIDACGCRQSQKLPCCVCLCLASVCLASLKPRGRIKVTNEVSRASPDPFERVYGQSYFAAAASQLEYVGRRVLLFVPSRKATIDAR